MKPDLNELRQIAESAKGTTRVSWSPEEAMWLLDRLDAAEGMAGAAITYARQCQKAMSKATGAMKEAPSAGSPVRGVVDYLCRYYPGQKIERIWPEAKNEAPRSY